MNKKRKQNIQTTQMKQILGMAARLERQEFGRFVLEEYESRSFSICQPLENAF